MESETKLEVDLYIRRAPVVLAFHTSLCLAVGFRPVPC